MKIINYTLAIISVIVSLSDKSMPNQHNKDKNSIRIRQVEIPRELLPFSSDLGLNVNFDNVPDAESGINGPLTRLDHTIEEAWQTFKRKFSKVYSSQEEEHFRREAFIENANKIYRRNDEFAQGFVSYTERINEYADMLYHEFERSLNGFNRSVSQLRTERPSTFIARANVPIPNSIDWRKLGAVTSVKSQGLCAACYAFSAIGALEGQYYRKTGLLRDLSAQNLIDCSNDYGNNGCSGGLMTPSYQYIKDNYGIAAESSYEYKGTQKSCRYQRESFAVDCTGYVRIPEGDEEALKNAVATLGPISVAIDGSQETLQFYADGVYFDGECKNETEDLNHAVLVVGYDTDPDGKQFWWVKNSYGFGWGIGGYMKMARNAGNHCGIATLASYPLV